MRGYLAIDMIWGGMTEDASGCELLCPIGAPSSGTLTWLNDGTEIPVYGKDNGSYQLRFFADDDTVDLAGWVQYANGKPGCCQDFSSDGGFGVEDCPEDIGDTED